MKLELIQKAQMLFGKPIRRCMSMFSILGSSCCICYSLDGLSDVLGQKALEPDFTLKEGAKEKGEAENGGEGEPDGSRP